MKALWHDGRSVVWEVDNLGNGSGLLWINRWLGHYFFHSSDHESEGPFTTLSEAMENLLWGCGVPEDGDLETYERSATWELTSDGLALPELLNLGLRLIADGYGIVINSTPYVRKGHELIVAAR